MIVLDTDVVSELMRDNPWPAVLAWVNDQLVHNLFVTAVTEAEIRAGIAFLPEGKRRWGLAKAAERAFSELFSGRLLPFDSEAARSYAGIAAQRRKAGRPIAQSRLPNRGDRPFSGRGGGDKEYTGFRGDRCRCHRPLGGQMSSSAKQGRIRIGEEDNGTGASPVCRRVFAA